MEPAPQPGAVRKPDGPFPFPKGQPAFRNQTPASMRPGFWLGRAPRAIVPWRGRELKRDGPIRRRADRRGIRRARERLWSRPGRRDGRAPPNFATARAWQAVSPGRRCPRRSNSIPTLVAGSVPPRAPAAPGSNFWIITATSLAPVSFRGRGQKNPFAVTRRCAAIYGVYAPFVDGTAGRACKSGAQLELDAQPFSASAFSARLVHSSAISSRIAFWCGSALRAIRRHSSANFRYVSDSPIIRSFASQSAVRYLVTLIQYRGTDRNKPRGGRVP